MNIEVIFKGSLCYAQIDGMYTPDEISLIQKELVYLETIKQDPSKTYTAKDGDKFLKTGSGVFVDEVYQDRRYSAILQINRKLFDPKVADVLVSKSCFFGHIKNCNSDSTLVNFYKDSEYYGVHSDTTMLSAVTVFSIGRFSGGQFCFPDYEVEIEPVEGRVIVFPGCVKHQAKAISALPGNYRVTMAQFLSYEHRGA